MPDLHRVAIKIIFKHVTTFNGGNINLEDVIDTPNFLFIVLELAKGKELFEKIVENTKLKKAKAKLDFFHLDHQEPALQEDLSQGPEA